jgi:hypothetical protein
MAVEKVDDGPVSGEDSPRNTTIVTSINNHGYILSEPEQKCKVSSLCEGHHEEMQE